MSIAERLKKLRIERGFRSAAEAAREMGVSIPTYSAHENGTTPPPRDEVIRYAEFYRTTTDFILTGKGRPRRGSRIPVVGYVGLGGLVVPFDAYERGDGLDHIDVPFDLLPSAQAVIGRGTSMLPAYEDGDILIYDEISEDPSGFVGRRVVVKLQDGRILVKRLRKGSMPGFWTLESFNDQPIEDVAVSWVARIKYVVPRW